MRPLYLMIEFAEDFSNSYFNSETMFIRKRRKNHKKIRGQSLSSVHCLAKYSYSKSEKTSLLLEQFLIDIGKKSGLLIN